MSGIRILSGQEVMDILDMRSVIKADEQAFAYKSGGKAEVYPLICKMYDNGGLWFSGKCASWAAAEQRHDCSI